MQDIRARAKGTWVEVTGLILLLSSWLAIFASGRIAPERVPDVWFLVLCVGLLGALVAGILAGRMASRWWYFISGMSLLTAGVMLAGAAV